MSKPFRDLRQKLSPAAQKRITEKTVEMMQSMPLQELRLARNLSQEKIAKILHTKQANVSRLERRSDMYISTLQTYVTAMGGKLDIIVCFPEGKVHLAQFNQLKKKR
jgi:transcriptional regulator